jgi:hypothetical protein
MTREIPVGGDIMQMTDDHVEFFRPGMAWTPGSTGATGNQFAGRISDARTARIVAYNLLLWAEEVDSRRSR